MPQRKLILAGAALGIVVLAGVAAIGTPGLSAARAGATAAALPAPMPIASPGPAPTAASLALVAQATASPVQRVLPQDQAQVELSFASVVKEVAPAVVNVYATTITRQQNSPFLSDPFFSQLFGGNSQLFAARPRPSQSLGSGVIIDPSGIIVTNSHVVSGATNVKVALQNGRQYDVDVLLDDTKTDLAVLRIEKPGGKTFPALQFGDSDGLEVGDIVLAIGNPFGVGQTVTSGIVSALARTGVESSDYQAFIQTDAAINPGNSGGALVDLSGHVIGINTAIYSRSGGSVGIGFAIPANLVDVVVAAGEHGAKLVFPWLGARLQEVTPDIADSLGIDPPRGAMITDVAQGSPAAQAGLKSGDVILSIDGTQVDEPQVLNYHIATHPIGSTATLALQRGTQTLQVSVKLVAPPQSGGDDTVTISGDTRFSGATAATLTPSVAQDNGLSFNAKGVVITNIVSGSPADDLGLQQGDVIVSLNGTPTNDAATFKQIASGNGSGWQIVLQRQGQTIRTYIDG